MSLLYTALPARNAQEAATAARTLAASFVTALQLSVHEWWRRRQGRHELARMDERGLRDLGLSRADVFREVRKPFWRT
jgi:uncharacterized protein YjiS (DUF1127 family)